MSTKLTLAASLMLAAIFSLTAMAPVQADSGPTRAQQYRDKHFKLGNPGRHIEREHRKERSGKHHHGRHGKDLRREVHKPRHHWQSNRHRGFKHHLNRHHRPDIGHRINRLPRHYQTLHRNRHTYHHHNGTFYRPYYNRYVVVHAPLGARFRELPDGYISFHIGTRRYFYLNYAYYLWDSPSRRYVVVEEPDGVEEALIAASHNSAGDIFIYPNKDQSEAQRDQDRYECYLWAVDQTGFDPGADDPDRNQAADYRRAISACLEGRDYTVR